MVFNGDNNRVEVDDGGDNCDNRVEMMLLLWRRCCAEVISVGCHLTVATVATVVTDVPSQPSIVVFICDNNRDEVDGDNCGDNRVEMLTNTYDSYYYVVTSL